MRYEIGICIRTGFIVWKNGGYPCGAYPDLKLAREAYVGSINKDEMTLLTRVIMTQNFSFYQIMKMVLCINALCLDTKP